MDSSPTPPVATPAPKVEAVEAPAPESKKAEEIPESTPEPTKTEEILESSPESKVEHTPEPTPEPKAEETPEPAPKAEKTPEPAPKAESETTNDLSALGDSIVKKLNGAGYTSSADIKKASDDELLALKGIGQAALKKIRALPI